MPGIVVHDLDVTREGRWEFRSGSEVAWCPPDRYAFTCRFDPFPAYPHDRDTAVAAAAHVQACCPPLWDVHCYLADREENSRSNGHSNIEEGRYVSGEWVAERTGLILMSGKRIPPHPAMTRHLTGHEYGHNVACMLNSLRGDGAKNVASADPLYQEYAAVRGLPASSVHHGDGGTWHDSACEIFADDFRILVCGLEAEFWPHPGITRPERIPAVRDWWDAALAGLAGAPR